MIILSEDSGGYRTNWHCEPPPPGAWFQVLRESWDCFLLVRNVYDVELLPFHVRQLTMEELTSSAAKAARGGGLSP